MDDRTAIARAQAFLRRANIPWTEQLGIQNFAQFYNTVADVVRGMSPKERAAIPDMLQWAERFRALVDDFDERIRRDPTLAYTPRTAKHQAFHDSNAFIKYLISANGIGKTLMAYMEDIWIATGQKGHKRGNVSVVSTGHVGYSEKVFVTKMLTGEDDDPYSPYVPEDGYWFHSFDQRKYLLRLACPPCAEAGMPKKCSHTKSIHCLSADSGMDRLMGFTSRRIHVDEHIPAEVWHELIQRFARVKDGSAAVTATPLAGPDAWEVKELYTLWKKYPEKNWKNPTDHSTGRYVDVFQISKYDCVGTHNGPTLESIEAERLVLPASEFRVRVMGEPIPLGDSYFDLRIIDKIEEEEVKEPTYGRLELVNTTIESLEYAEDLFFEPELHHGEEAFRGLSVWEHPQSGCQYVIGVDTAAGGNGSGNNDASAAYVFKLLGNDGELPKLEMVAGWHSYDDVYKYAAEMKKLATYYNMALIVPEVTGIGIPFMTTIYRVLLYVNVWQGENSADQTNYNPDSYFGMKTTSQSKPLMAMALKQYIHNRQMVIRDKEALSECRTFQQTRSESGQSYRYEAASGAHDDRVLAMSFPCYACLNSKDLVWAFSTSPLKKPEKPKEDNAVSLPQQKKKSWIV